MFPFRFTAHSAREGFAATIINGMRAQKIGRALGIGLRVAGRIAEERIAGQQKSPQPRAWAGSGSTAAATARSAGQVTARASGGVARGVGGFLKLCTRLGGILFLEVTGAFGNRLQLLPVEGLARSPGRGSLAPRRRGAGCNHVYLPGSQLLLACPPKVMPLAAPSQKAFHAPSNQNPKKLGRISIRPSRSVSRA